MANGTDWAVWEGPEVEGRLTGIRTLFVGNRANPAQVLAHAQQYPHIYFNPDFTLVYGYDVPLQLAASHIVTVALPLNRLPFAPADVLALCHVQAIIDAPGLERLKGTDTIRLDSGAFHVHCVTCSQLQETQPEQYDADRLLEKVI